MGWILFKRAVRDLKAGWARYIALSLLIIFSIFIVTSLMGAAATVIDYTELRDRELCREDGDLFRVNVLSDLVSDKMTAPSLLRINPATSSGTLLSDSFPLSGWVTSNDAPAFRA